MAFFNEFPHTRTYDSDLAWLIERMKEILTRMDTLEEKMAALEELVNNFIETLNIDELIKQELSNMIARGDFDAIIRTLFSAAYPHLMINGDFILYAVTIPTMNSEQNMVLADSWGYLSRIRGGMMYLKTNAYNSYKWTFGVKISDLKAGLLQTASLIKTPIGDKAPMYVYDISNTNETQSGNTYTYLICASGKVEPIRYSNSSDPYIKSINTLTQSGVGTNAESIILLPLHYSTAFMEEMLMNV